MPDSPLAPEAHPASGASAPFRAFADTLAAIAEESGRNAKADLLGGLLRDLNAADLRCAARWAAGRVFPLSDQRTVNVGHSALLKAIASASGVEPDALRPKLVQLGDPGDVAADVLDDGSASDDGPTPRSNAPETAVGSVPLREGDNPDPASGDLQAGDDRGLIVPPDKGDSFETEGEQSGRSQTASVPRTAPEASGATFTLADAAIFFADLAATRGSKKRTEKTAAQLETLSAPEARFLVKLLSGETRIGLLQGGVEAALARTFEREAAAVRRAHMLTGDLGEAAVLAREDRLGEAEFALFHPITFMLATPAESAPGEDPAPEVARLMPETFAVEDKYDGIRAQVHIAPLAPEDARSTETDDTLHGQIVQGPAGPTRVSIFSRTLDENTGQFPDLVEPLAALAASNPRGLVLDGEIVPVWPGEEGLRVAPFASLQKRLGRKKPPEAVLAEFPVAFVAYDVLYASGELCLDEPLRERQRRLSDLPLAAPLHATRVTVMDDPALLDEAFGAARARGNEGLMVKRLDSAYRPGRRGREWLKIKRALATLDVVVTSVEVGSGGRRKYLSDYTFAVRMSREDPTLVNVGKAYSGLTDAELAELTEWFKAHTRQQFAHGRVRVVDPEIVLEVAFDAVQESKRHKSGFALRFPRIVRLRPDKPAAEVDTVETVRAIYGSQHAIPGATP